MSKRITCPRCKYTFMPKARHVSTGERKEMRLIEEILSAWASGKKKKVVELSKKVLQQHGMSLQKVRRPAKRKKKKR
ncbi:hypothetical protein FJZ53_04720 [Candidatus Woesearchaeota archaeon]|nr:hypothetical protein [Candidatus Woesearchaeota archaeon]